MTVTPMTWVVALGGLGLISLLLAAQLAALCRPRAEWTIKNIYGGDPSSTDPKAYFAVNQGYAWADTLLWAPMQIAGSIGMLLNARWGFLLALAASVPFLYSAITIFLWDRDLAFRKSTISYWVVWGVFPAFGALEFFYCFTRLMA